ncbi:AIPR family protein [Halomonas heilongjiangensis]|uniref:Abortive phage infection protein C-terminal domain-containing protein n=1 Tax=Halomonas heilongjiangensis TaxID=1387883 RepID=A0A2N7TQE4_9GAMM|nr:AIPR family protein [Halomonas heilongjiangensis]PMR70407.1 hypothetical protein C1H66_06560 [Halomonas heilongjiangensis]PXX91367.1 hypothetical protein CR158_07590 [Halomonas heilongjiangensis]
MNLKDFSLVRERINKIAGDRGLKASSAFYFFCMDLVLSINDTEIEDSITDTEYLLLTGGQSGKDKGVDAVYIDEDQNPPVISFFNCKYTGKVDKLENHFPSSESTKVIDFFSKLLEQDIDLIKEVNPVLAGKVEQIWSIFSKVNPELRLYFCSNSYNRMVGEEYAAIKRDLESKRRVSVDFFLMDNMVSRLLLEDHVPVNAKIKAVGKHYFEKSDGNVKALIAEFDARDLIRIVCRNEAIRNNPDPEDYSVLAYEDLDENAFKDNVRVYLKQRTKINQNIKNTVRSEDRGKVFYFNNGITITCDSFNYPGGNRTSPIVDLQNLQIVNGCQTINSLFEAYKESPDCFEEGNVDLLCKIYQTVDKELSTKICEYTNSQNPVKSRDIKSIDYYQIGLEKQLADRGYWYERKKNQFSDEDKEKRIDSELVGQLLYAFFNGCPAEAKNKKRLIFGDSYDEIFSESITSEEVLLVWKLFKLIEFSKIEKRSILKEFEEGERLKKSFILYADFYLLYLMRLKAEKDGVDISLGNLDDIWALYDECCDELEEMVHQEAINHESNSIYTGYFKNNRVKMKIEDKYPLG